MIYFKRLFSTRLSRGGYFLTSLIMPFLIYGVMGIGVIIGQVSELSYLAVALIIGIDSYLLLIALSAAIRRCHDFGKSGYFLLLNLIPVVNLYLFFMIYFGRQDKVNKYGEPAYGASLKTIFGFK